MGKTEEFLKAELNRKRTLLFVLIDSEESQAEEAARRSLAVQEMGASSILVGGSSATNQFELAGVVKRIKQEIKIPLILFPGNITGMVPGADAILFSSLMNSENPYYISQAQALGAPNIRKFKLEPLPTAYLVVGRDTSAWFVGSARAIPFDKPQIAAAYSMAAGFLGMRFVYLEAGSGAECSITPKMVGAVRKAFDGFLIVGGGIRDKETALAIAEAGANAIVIGTLLEKGGGIDEFGKIARAIR